MPVGHTPERGLTITLNTPFVESLSPEQLDHYVRTVVELHGGVGDTNLDDLASMLRRRLEDGDVRLPDTSYDRLAQQLTETNGAPLSIITDRDELLYGDAAAKAANHMPQSPGTADPEHPDRPTYS
ncbi:hypothetical protein ASG70_03080 [Phycicoccus sp. Soil748]|nr:hypothetical protein ASG70_03080 [Phycicoccus sp. Soil748]